MASQQQDVESLITELASSSLPGLELKRLYEISDLRLAVAPLMKSFRRDKKKWPAVLCEFFVKAGGEDAVEALEEILNHFRPSSDSYAICHWVPLVS